MQFRRQLFPVMLGAQCICLSKGDVSDQFCIALFQTNQSRRIRHWYIIFQRKPLNILHFESYSGMVKVFRFIVK